VRRGRNVPLWTAIAATVVAAVLAYVDARVSRLPGLTGLEGLSVDMRFRLRGPRAPGTDRIVIVGIDDKTRRADGDLVQLRRGYARLVDAVSACRPKVIALDLFFNSREELLPAELAERLRAASLEPGPSRDLIADVVEYLRGDEILADAIARSKVVMLGAFFQSGGPVRGVEEPVGLRSARLGEVADTGGGDPQRRPISAGGVVYSLPMFAKGALGAGALNDLRDDDAVRRRMPLVVEYGGRHYMSLGLAVALQELGKPRDTSYVAGAPTLHAAGKELALTRAASLPLDVLGKDQIPRVSAIDVVEGKACAQLAGKLVFVGLTYATFDKVATPLDPLADGVELHATVAENVLSGNLMRNAGSWAAIGATLLLGGIVSAAHLRRIRRRAWVPPLVAVAALVGYVIIAVVLFDGGTVLDIAAPAVLTAFVLLAATVGNLATEGREKAHLRGVFSQYVSRPVVDRILADPSRAKLGGERKELTVLFSDIRGFSHFSEGMAAAFLGEYLTPMTDLVLASGGTLDKYIGDAIMAIWGAPVDLLDHAARACDAALKMHESLAQLNVAWAKAGRPEVAIGIGINTGAMAVGNMGSAARFEYTVLGDQVNLGSRLEALTKDYGVGILVGEATVRAAGDAFVFRELDLVRLKGRAGAAPVFELVGRAGKADPSFARALALYRERKFAAAREIFAGLVDDPAARVMATRCDELAASPPPDDWGGVYEQRTK